ncbi:MULTISPECIES: hypothetical protein [Enterobacteriaceae]|uniref:hypothetical protein n=1 Tax=Enterobacteriaceae TaxID=543 RepID=UPI000E204E2A|nr:MULTISPECIES: hypothetical protein [Enterobacteriaceae]URR10731.1 hypothetical protein L1S38_24245 [Enterobacter roggenkampii]URR20904.1 hypothetical protein LT990_26030 [Klebsiella quasipneumoniae]
MSQGCASGGVRLLTPAELDALRDEMQRDGEWAREELARRRAARIATVKAALEDDDNADT